MFEVKLHDIGEGITEGEIVHYLVKEGDEVTADQPLVEVQTDKMVAELPSPTTGKIKEIAVTTGETVPVGTTLLFIEAEGSIKTPQQITSHHDEPHQKREEQIHSQTQQTKKFIRVLAAPYTRKIARDHSIDIEQVEASDPSGRVTEEDVYRFIKGEQTTPTIDQKASEQKDKAIEQPESLEEIPFRGIRKTIATKMSKSLFTIPHVTHFDEIDMTNLLSLRTQMKQSGVHVSVPAFFIKALVFTLKDYPVFNAELDEENEIIKLKKDYHIGLAADTENGLMVPVLRNADRKSLTTINEEIHSLNEQVNNNELTPAQMQGSTFTMSNVGPLGSTGATPIINYPETALIAFHQTKKTPIVNEHNEIVIGHMMNVSMSFDHRVTDGGTAIGFTNRLAELLHEPYKLMVEMV